MAKNQSTFPPELQSLDQSIGEFMEYWGFKKIHGRVWLHLYLSEEPLDVSTLMSRLKVSKALMSFCMRELLDYKVILESGSAKHGTVLYIANPDLFSVIRNVLRSRERTLLAKIKMSQELAASLATTDLEQFKVNPQKLKTLGRLIHAADKILQLIVHLKLETEGNEKGLFNMLSMLTGLKAKN